MTKLKIAEGLTLPLEVVTQTVAILAKRRAGKSYTMRRLIEQLLKAGQQVVIVDPKGDQWGLRSAANGKDPGLPIVILGGERGDVPLEVSSGEVVAKLVVEDRISVLLDLSLFRKREFPVFMTAFLENLYRLKAREMYRTPMMLVVDEADAIAPQKPMPGEEGMLGAIEDIVRRGGQRGIGCVVVTQRSAVLNKNVLTQAQILVALRTIAPQDLKAMKEWIDVHGEEDQRKVLMESLPSLPVGDAWFWSPGWPTVQGIFKRVHVLPIETFDSGKSPDPGVKPVEPKNLADVDLEALKGQMAATIEKKKAEDPKELRKQLVEARAQIAAKDKLLAEVDARTKRIDEKLSKVQTSKREAERAAKLTELKQQLAQHQRALEAAMKILIKIRAIGFESPEDTEAMQKAIAAAVKQVTAPIEKRVTALAERVEGFKSAAAKAEQEIAALLEQKIDLSVTVQKTEPFTVSPSAAPKPHPPRREPTARTVDAGLPPAKQKILNALAFLEGIGVPSAERAQLALLADTTPASSAFANNLGALRSAGFIDYPGQNRVSLTDNGRAAAIADNVPSTSAQLHDVLRSKLPPAKWRIVYAAISAYPEAISKAALAAAADTTPESSAYANNLGSLRSLGLIDYPGPGLVKAQPVLFLEGR